MARYLTKFIFLIILTIPMKTMALCPLEAQFRMSALFFGEEKARKIYGHAIPFYQIELGAQVPGELSWCPGQWGVWADFGYLSKQGRSIGLHHKTHLKLYPFGLGAKWSMCLCDRVDVYLGYGGTYSILRIKDHSPFVQERRDKNAFGIGLKSGVRYQAYEGFFLEAFLDYDYTKFRFSHSKHNIESNDWNMSAVILGAGIGYQF